MREQLAAMLIGLLGGVGAQGEPPARPQLHLPELGRAPLAAAPFADAPRLMLQPIPQPQTIYAPPQVTHASGGYNEGALSIDITGRYMTDYVFRGMEVVEPQTREDATNFQLEAELRLDLGRLPDPFLRFMTNTAEGDDLSNFQVIRPAVGLIWETELFEVALGTQTFTYPDRTELDSAEVFLDLRINDGALLAEDEPILGPFIFAAYDFDRYNGLYAEAGLRRTFDVPRANLTVTVEGLVAYVNNYDLHLALGAGDDTGFSHYQVGLIAEYRLNTLLNISRRYGQWGVAGYLYYTDAIDSDLAATTQLWGGAGITFRY